MSQSKKQLRKKYRISNEDFEILTTLPPDAEIRKKGFLVKVGEVLGAEEWMWKTWTGIVLAVIVIAPQAESIVDFWQPKVVYSARQFHDYFRHLKWPLEPSDDQWLAFVPHSTLPHIKSAPSRRDLAVGTGLFPGPAEMDGAAPIQFVSEIRYHFRERFTDVPPGQKELSAPEAEHEMLPLSFVTQSGHRVGRVVEGSVAHLPYRFRVSVFHPDVTVEIFEGERLLKGFPQTIQHSFTKHWDSRIDFVIPVDEGTTSLLERSLLGENCFLAYANIVLGADDDLISTGLLRPHMSA
jgi:hypothetical protein